MNGVAILGHDRVVFSLCVYTVLVQGFPMSNTVYISVEVTL